MGEELSVVFFTRKELQDRLPAMMVGIDDIGRWVIGPKFRGFEGLQSGFHLLTIQLVDELDHSSCSMIITTFVLWIKPSMKPFTLILEYDARNEDWEPITTKPELERTIREQYRHHMWDGYMAPIHRQEKKPEFSKIPSHVYIQSIDSMNSDHPAFYSYGDHVIYKIDTHSKLIPALFPDINLASSFPKSASPSLVTKYSLDKSHLLERILKKYQGDYKHLIAHIELSFYIFFYGQHIDGLDFWKKAVCLICYSEESLLTKPKEFFLDFMQLIQDQLGIMWKHDSCDKKNVDMEELLFILFSKDPTSGDNGWFSECIATFFMNIDENAASNQDLLMVQKKSLEFQNYMQELLGFTVSRFVE
jgi:hypothetical protein